MERTSAGTASEIERYLRTGIADPYHAAWSGTSFLDCARRAREDLIGVLVAEVECRRQAQPTTTARRDIDLVGLTRRKAEPLVRGLFPQAEQRAVLSLVESSVVFVTPGNISSVLRGCKWSNPPYPKSRRGRLQRIETLDQRRRRDSFLP